MNVAEGIETVALSRASYIVPMGCRLGKREYCIHQLKDGGVGDLQVYNLCVEATYDAENFHGRVEVLPFDDNYVPPLALMKQFCESVHEWLSSDPRNVAVIHCRVSVAECFSLHGLHNNHIVVLTNPKNRLNMHYINFSQNNQSLFLVPSVIDEI